MSDLINIAVRFALYLDLMLLFGLPLFGIYALRGEERISGTALKFAPLLASMSLIGILLSIVGMLVLAKSMSGASTFLELDKQVFEMVIVGTDVGQAWVLRMVALGLALACIGFAKRRPVLCLGLVSFFSAIALATLAWKGHAVMNEGVQLYLHVTSDILHMIAAGGWLGALAAFALLLNPSKLNASQHMHLLNRVLTGFATVGSIFVALIIITGIINYLFIVGPTIIGLVSSLYGQLLLIKLVLFAIMACLAAANRWRLSPLLERSIHHGEHDIAITALRRSLFIELGTAVVILGLVAWLGILSPSIRMS